MTSHTLQCWSVGARMYPNFFSCGNIVYRFNTYFVVVAGSMRFCSMSLSNFGIKLHFNLSLCSIFCLWSWSYFQYMIWVCLWWEDTRVPYGPRPNSLNNLLGSIVFRIYCRSLLYLWSLFDYVHLRCLLKIVVNSHLVHISYNYNLVFLVPTSDASFYLMIFVTGVLEHSFNELRIVFSVCPCTS